MQLVLGRLVAAWRSDRHQIAGLCARLQLLAVLPLMIVMAFAMKPFGVPDEVNHFAKSVAVSTGALSPQRGSELVNGSQRPVSGAMLDRGVIEALEEGDRDPFNGLYDRARMERLSQIREAGSVAFRSFNNTAIYPPINYVPAAIATAVGRAAGAPVLWWLYLGRLFNIAVFVAAGLYAMRVAGSKAPVLLLFGLLPITLQQVASVSADSILFASALVFASLLYALQRGDRLRKHHIVALGIAGFMIGAGKISYLPFCLLPTMIAYARDKRWSEDARLLAAFALGTGLFTLGWGGLTADDVFTYRHHVRIDVAAQLGHVFAHPIDSIILVVRTATAELVDMSLQAVGKRLGWLTIQFPHLIAAALVSSLVFWSIFSGDEKDRAAMSKAFAGAAAISTLCWLSIYGLLYLQWNPVASTTIVGFQGRYLTPPLLITLMLAPNMLRVRIPRTGILVMSTLVAALAGTLAIHLIASVGWA